MVLTRLTTLSFQESQLELILIGRPTGSLFLSRLPLEIRREIYWATTTITQLARSPGEIVPSSMLRDHKINQLWTRLFNPALGGSRMRNVPRPGRPFTKNSLGSVANMSPDLGRSHKYRVRFRGTGRSCHFCGSVLAPAAFRCDQTPSVPWKT